MPLYFFNVYDGVERPDCVGTEIVDLHQARLEAVRHAGHLLRDHAEGIAGGEDWHLEVADQTGLILFRLDIQATDAPACRPDPLMKR